MIINFTERNGSPVEHFMPQHSSHAGSEERYVCFHEFTFWKKKKNSTGCLILCHKKRRKCSQWWRVTFLLPLTRFFLMEWMISLLVSFWALPKKALFISLWAIPRKALSFTAYYQGRVKNEFPLSISDSQSPFSFLYCDLLTHSIFLWFKVLLVIPF